MIMLFIAKTLKNKEIYNIIKMEKKATHRAMVLQGGGSLGAYEAGVYRV
jgi:predicted acylesterase/phospholipase RssA